MGFSLWIVVLGLSCAAYAQEGWDTVMQDREREVQIDRGSVMLSDRGTRVAWARVVLSPAEAAIAGHTVVQALNRYDCVNRSITTLRRRYLDARNIIVREESVSDPRAVTVAANSVDERLWREVCQPGGMAELERIAAEATRLISGMGGDAVVRDAPALQVPREEPAERAPVVDAVSVPVPAQAAMSSAARSAPVVAPAPELVEAPAQAAASRRTPVVVTDESGWSYHGESGPANWGKMHPEWALCERGARQSPVDLRNGIRLDLEPLRFDYRETRFRVSDSGRALEVQVGEGLTIDIRGQRFVLEHMSFHSPSEIRVEGRPSPLAVHFHHRDEAGMQAVVAVSFQGGGAAHPVLQEILNAMPIDRSAWHMPQTTIEPGGLVPQDPAYFLFLGSLSTPPCTEGVTWVAMKTPVVASDEQIEILRRLHPDNTRPVQALNNRLVLESR
jgi:carbonic anhydrase